MLVMHAMTPTVISVLPSQSILAAIRKMLDYSISGLPVIDSHGNLIGIISEGDFLRRSELGTEKKRNRWINFLLSPGKLAEEFVRTHGRMVEEIMTTDPFTTEEYTPLQEAAALMIKHRIHRLPIVRGQKVVGILTRKDLMKAVAARGHALPELRDSDQAIREKILQEIQKQPWALFPLSVTVLVKDGIVDLVGASTNAQQAKALEVLATNTKGVRSVRNGIAVLEATGNED